jgi:hypothetical protein
MSASLGNEKRWYVRRLPKFDHFDEATVIEISQYYKNFECLD